MMSKRTLTLALRGGIPALLVAVAVADDGSASVLVWAGAAALWVASVLLWDFVVAARVKFLRGRAALRISVKQADLNLGPAQVRALSRLLANAQTNPRVNARSLRPRLSALAEHYVPIHHGFDIERDPDRAASLLGDVAWLIDRNVADRAPTSGDIEQFLNIVLIGQSETTSTRRNNPQRLAT